MCLKILTSNQLKGKFSLSRLKLYPSWTTKSVFLISISLGSITSKPLPPPKCPHHVIDHQCQLDFSKIWIILAAKIKNLRNLVRLSLMTKSVTTVNTLAHIPRLSNVMAWRVSHAKKSSIWSVLALAGSLKNGGVFSVSQMT